jgi:ABC-2 type transport system permease protein
MNPQRAWAIVLRQFYLMRSSPTRLVPMFAWVAVDIVLWGFFTRYLNGISSGGMNFVPRLLGAVLFWDFFTRVMQGVTTAFFEDVWSRNFVNIFSAPLSLADYLGGLVLTSIATSVIGLAVMMTLATTIFGLSFLVYGILLVPFVMVLFLFGIALGVVASAMVLRLGPASEWLVWPMPALLSPFVGVFYPLATLPHWMQQVSRLLPPSYMFEAMRSIVSGGSASWTQLSIGLAIALAELALAFWIFAYIFRGAVRSGRLARYSAEGIG